MIKRVLMILVCGLWPILALAQPVAAGQTAKAQAEGPAPRMLRLGFKEMGARGPLMLRGVEGSISLPFSVRSDEVVVAAKLHINYQYSPALLEELSHLVITVNEEVAAALPLPKGDGMNNLREINLDPRLFADTNKLAFRLIGHYTYRCEDPSHSSLWLSLAQAGSLELTLMPLALATDLRLLPNPFFDRRDQGRLRLPFVFEQVPTPGMLKAAGIVASWFGSQAGYRGATFPVSLNGLPAGHAVVFRRKAPEAGERGPNLAMQAHPTVPGAKLLVITGEDDAALQRVARALVFADGALSGARIVVSGENMPSARHPYDAPAWLPIDRPVRFGELLPLQDMQVRGYYPEVIRMNFRVAPDLFTWRSTGVPMELKYRFTRLPYNKNSSLNISLNDNFIHALALNDPERRNAEKDTLRLPVLDQNLALRKDVLFVPPYQVGGRNQMQFHFYFDIHKQGECRDSIPDNMRAMIDPESTIDFSGFPHYVALPNLAYFANIGFPFTRFADLSETTVVMPDAPTPAEMQMYLDLMARMGEATGYPAIRHSLATAGSVDQHADNDLIIIGSHTSQPLFNRWAEYMALVDHEGERRLSSPDKFLRSTYRWEQQDVQLRPDTLGNISFSGGGTLAATIAFESPLRNGRSVVAFYGDQPDSLRAISNALMDPERVARFQGDWVIVRGDKVDHYQVSDTYYVGSLPWLLKLRWLFAQRPLLLGFLSVLLASLAAILSYRSLRRLAARRLAAKH